MPEFTIITLKDCLSQYLSRPLLCLKRFRYYPFKSRALFHTTYTECFTQNSRMFGALGFIRSAYRLRLRNPYPCWWTGPKRCSLSDGQPKEDRLHSSRLKVLWSEMVYIVVRVPSGWRASPIAATEDKRDLAFELLSAAETVEVDADYHK